MARYVTGSTGIVVSVPEADAAVADVRARFDPALTYGVPAHITVLFPWLPIESVDDAALRALRELTAATSSFDAELVAVGRFPEVAWLAPTPSERFVGLTRMVASRWPEHPPYQGRIDEPIPHLTIADGQPDDLLNAVSAEVIPRLPIAFRVDALTVLSFDGVCWSPLARVALG